MPDAFINAENHFSLRSASPISGRSSAPCRMRAAERDCGQIGQCRLSLRESRVLGGAKGDIFDPRSQNLLDVVVWTSESILHPFPEFFHALAFRHQFHTTSLCLGRAGDINAFFGLILDNVAVMSVLLVLITSAEPSSTTFSREFVFRQMIPGTAHGRRAGRSGLYVDGLPLGAAHRPHGRYRHAAGTGHAEHLRRRRSWCSCRRCGTAWTNCTTTTARRCSSPGTSARCCW